MFNWFPKEATDGAIGDLRRTSDAGTFRQTD